MGQNTAARQIGIDMGHRVTHHGSKCRNIHGHRYTIEAVIGGELVVAGASEGMLLDFGFLKEEMMQEIDFFCDHGLVLWLNDPLLLGAARPTMPMGDVRQRVHQQRWCATEWEGGKLYVMDRVPTAENLAAHWYARLAPRVAFRTEGKAFLVGVKVWETPNCWAEYQG